jgi:hypothetical protein
MHVATACPYLTPPAIEGELEWFFARRDRGDVDYLPYYPDRDWDEIAYRTIRRWLAAMDDYDARVLDVAYSKGPRPPRLHARLGSLTTVVVRLASTEAGWPEDPEEQRSLELRMATLLDDERAVHGPRTVRRYIRPAAELLRAAVRAYARERGPGPSMVYAVTRLETFAWTRTILSRRAWKEEGAESATRTPSARLLSTG